MRQADDTQAAVWIPTVHADADAGPEASSLGHAVVGYELTQTTALVRSDDDILTRARFWELAWTLLEDGALEFRWVASKGLLRTYLFVRHRGLTSAEGEAEARRIGAAARALLQRVSPGIRLRALAAVEGAAAPVAWVGNGGEGGDLLRSMLEVDANAHALDVPTPLTPGLSARSLLAREMSDSPVPVCVSLVAAPLALDLLERRELDRDMTTLEQMVLKARRPSEAAGHTSSAHIAEDLPLARLEASAAALAHRMQHLSRLGSLRISVASAGQMPLTFLAAARASLGWSAGPLVYAPAAELGEQVTFRRNLASVGFEPWGVLAERGIEHRMVSDRYLASLTEVVACAWLPPIDEVTEGPTSLAEPAPRAVPGMVPHQGALIGSNFASPAPREVALSDEDRSRHMLIWGQTGSGKSTLAANLALRDIRAGEGVCVIDPHGDLVDEILLRFPEERRDDLVLFDPSDDTVALGLNLFEAKNQFEQDFVIQQVISMLYRLYDPHHDGIIGPRFEHMLRSAALTVMADPAGGTFLEIPFMFTNERLLAAKLKHVQDPVVRSFWLDEQSRTSDYHKSEVLGWFLAKWGAFLSNGAMRRILGQHRSAFDFRTVMDSRKVLLVRLAKGRIGSINAQILGMILLSKLQLAALGRGDTSADQRKRFYLYVDEFQSFALSQFDELVSESRKYGLALTLMNQHSGQLSTTLREALFGNVGTLCAFRLGLHDAQLVAEELEGYSPRDLTRLENFRCVLRTSASGRVMTPFDVHTVALSELDAEAAVRRLELMELSRVRWGTPRDLAEEEALRFLRTAGSNERSES
ncbi:MAG: type IV secretion system DNA-binding domain-containing protein [Coriobacteriia bacterium]|nr:type IV secretion system DNA-binding domain-containing protein [Coriobacteriia bacterium]